MFLSVQVFKNFTRTSLFALLSAFSIAAWSANAWSANDNGSETIVPLHEQVQSLKKVVLELNRDLYLLEEALLFPSSTQVSVFVSVNTTNLFELDSVSLDIDGKEVANYLYTEKQSEGLKKGGVHRLHVGHLKSGSHQLVVTYRGVGPKGREYRRVKEHVFSKDTEAKFLEISIVGQSEDLQPEFQVREWQ
ncbi:AraC family transcriptional regulator [Litoribacillus peritrichatus]|uniref:AraC family transcriptional regulator n=1 Tax=Litoribacillus peritrichatus TaxID=718191 RepID=A0ABP7N5P8_9GAMM